jgi:VPDSG-CTERM motif
MKLLKYFVAVAALTVALTLSAEAHLDFLGAVGFDTQPNNNPDSNLAALGDFLGQDVSNFTLCGNFEDLNGGDQNIDVMAGSFLVVHYGKGSGGSSTGGSLEFFQVVDGETNVTVPGFPNAKDPFATGGISSIREFCPPTSAPDSGTTAMLLGSALAGLGLVRRHLKR